MIEDGKRSKKVIVPAPRETEFGDDTSGDKEAILLGSGKSLSELKSDALNREHDRTQKFKDNFEKITVCALWIAAVFALLISSALVFHMVAWKNYQWLSEDQVSSLKSLFTGGVLASLVVGHFKKRL